MYVYIESATALCNKTYVRTYEQLVLRIEDSYTKLWEAKTIYKIAYLSTTTEGTSITEITHTANG